MTLNELRESVVSLGFESSLDNEAVFASALRRALHTIAIDRPAVITQSIFVLSPGGRLVSDVFLHTGGNKESFTLDGRAYSFKVMGEGYCVIRDEDGECEERFSGSRIIRGFMRGPAEISFFGEHNYVVYSLAVFDICLGNDESDILIFGQRRDIDLAECIPELLSVSGMPTDKNGKPIMGAVLHGTRLSLPYSFTGEVTITFKMKRNPPSFDDENEMIDIPSECEELLPLLVAFYVWLDDASDKAEVYLSLYKDMLSSIKRSSASLINSLYATNGWA